MLRTILYTDSTLTYLRPDSYNILTGIYSPEQAKRQKERKKEKRKHMQASRLQSHAHTYAHPQKPSADTRVNNPVRGGSDSGYWEVGI